jgi:uncharacterized LabA/DUF88 family protein
MPEETYLFIDGKYLRDVHDRALRPIFGITPEVDLLNLKKQAGAQRVFFYDCMDETKLAGETDEAFQTRQQKQDKYFGSIRDGSGFHLRLGTLAGKRPKLRQKEVDVQLAVDMLTHGFSRNMVKAVLIAGDLDFRPIVEALVRGGVFVEIWYEKTSASRDLFWAADYGRELRFHDFYWMSDKKFLEKYRLPIERPNCENDLILATSKKSGTAAGKTVQLFDRGRVHWLHAVGWHGKSLTLELDNPEILERYFSAFYAPIEWR